MRANPYQLVEGLIIAAFAIGAEEAFVCLKPNFAREIEGLTHAIEEFQLAGICDECKITIVAGPDQYLFGEEEAMLEVIDGNEPLPRWLPPHIHAVSIRTTAIARPSTSKRLALPASSSSSRQRGMRWSLMDASVPTMAATLFIRDGGFHRAPPVEPARPQPWFGSVPCKAQRSRTSEVVAIMMISPLSATSQPWRD